MGFLKFVLFVFWSGLGVMGNRKSGRFKSDFYIVAQRLNLKCSQHKKKLIM